MFSPTPRIAKVALTPKDSPAIWKARPLNFVKCSKNIAMKAEISLPASAMVLYSPRISKLLARIT